VKVGDTVRMISGCTCGNDRYGEVVEIHQLQEVCWVRFFDDWEEEQEGDVVSFLFDELEVISESR